MKQHIHPTTENLEIVIGGIYTFTNKYNYTTTLKVSRVTDKSIFVYHLLSGGNWSTSDMREGVTSFKKFKLK